MGLNTPAEETPSRVLAITERELNKANVGFLALGAFVALLSICIAGIIREGVISPCLTCRLTLATLKSWYRGFQASLFPWWHWRSFTGPR